MNDQASPPARGLILYRTHFWDDACARECAALQSALSGVYDFIVTGSVPDPVPLKIPPAIPSYFPGPKELAALGYPLLPKLKLFHVDVFTVFRRYPDYAHYWMIEFDVRYTGDWAELLQELAASPADMLGTVVQSRVEHPAWIHWDGLSTGGVVLPEQNYVKAFAPLLRLSNAAMRAVDAAYMSGWAGHYEVLWPSAIANAGLSIEEIGGEGSFTPPSRQGRYYTASRFDPYLSPGSFVFRPSILEQDVPRNPPCLWHPVKPSEMAAPLPPPEPPPKATWRDAAWLQPVRWLRRRLRGVATTG